MIAQHVLVPIDFSEHGEPALTYAIDLASSLKSRLTLLHVMQTPLLGAGPAMGAGVPFAAYLTQRESDLSSALEACAQRVREAGVVCQTAIAHGAPFQLIIDLARARAVDLIIMSTHGRTGVPHMILGSVAEKVVRLAPCPVLVTRCPSVTTTS